VKRLLLIASAAALLAAPVFAQTQRPAQAPGHATQQKAPAVKGPNDVWCGGVYLGSDPDPNIRLQILKDYKHECN
jgi:hypothetical protein